MIWRTVLDVFEELFIEGRQIFRSARKRNSVARHGVLRAAHAKHPSYLQLKRHKRARASPFENVPKSRRSGGGIPHLVRPGNPARLHRRGKHPAPYQ